MFRFPIEGVPTPNDVAQAAASSIELLNVSRPAPYPVRPAKFATTIASSLGSTGFVTYD